MEAGLVGDVPGAGRGGFVVGHGLLDVCVAFSLCVESVSVGIFHGADWMGGGSGVDLDDCVGGAV